MDTRNSAMVIGLYAAGGVIIAAICLGYFAWERSSADPPSALDFQHGGGKTSATSQVGYFGSADYYHASLSKANQSLRELQSSLAASRDRIEKQNQTLNQKNAECQALKNELDGTFTLMLSLLADETSDIETTRESAKRAKTKVESELAKLIEALKQAEVLGAEQEQQLVRLRADLLRADLELANVHEQSELEMAALLVDRKTFETLTTEVIAQCGIAAVPALVERLTDERVEVRRWAVKALGAIGPPAQEAIDVISRLVSDPDPTVRQEAQRALAAVRES